LLKILFFGYISPFYFCFLGKTPNLDHCKNAFIVYIYPTFDCIAFYLQSIANPFYLFSVYNPIHIPSQDVFTEGWEASKMGHKTRFRFVIRFISPKSKEFQIFVT